MIDKIKSIIFASASLLLVAVLFYFVQFRYEKPQSIDLEDEAAKILEVIYEEGFSESSIDYTDPLLNRRMLFITTDLDEKAAEEIIKKLAYLDTMAPGQSIDLFIDTPGGSGGIMLANFIQTLQSPVNTRALDFCSSAGCEVLASGTGMRSAFSTSRILIHIVPQEDSYLDDPDFGFKSLQERVNAVFWKKYSSIPEEFYSSKEERFFNFDASQALEYGIIDQIIE